MMQFSYRIMNEIHTMMIIKKPLVDIVYKGSVIVHNMYCPHPHDPADYFSVTATEILT